MAEQAVEEPREQHGTQTPLQQAQQALQQFAELTARATAALENRHVLPYEQSAWRSQQDGLMDVARAAAMVAIAEQLSEISKSLYTLGRAYARAHGGGGGG